MSQKMQIKLEDYEQAVAIEMGMLRNENIKLSIQLRLATEENIKLKRDKPIEGND